MDLVSLEWGGEGAQTRIIVSPQMPIDCIKVPQTLKFLWTLFLNREYGGPDGK